MHNACVGIQVRRVPCCYLFLSNHVFVYIDIIVVTPMTTTVASDIMVIPVYYGCGADTFFMLPLLLSLLF